MSEIVTPNERDGATQTSGASAAPTERVHVTRSRANPGGIADVLTVLGPETLPMITQSPRVARS